MLTIDKSGLKSKEINGVKINDYREIALIKTKNPKYIYDFGKKTETTMSIYIVPDNYILDILDLCPPEGGGGGGADILSNIEEAKYKSGRAGRDIKKTYIDLLEKSLKKGGILDDEKLKDYLSLYSPDLDKDSINTKIKSIKKVYDKTLSLIINSSQEIVRYLQFNKEDLNYEGVKGELQPLPIKSNNLTTSKIKFMKEGKTIFYVLGPNGINEVETFGDNSDEIIKLAKSKALSPETGGNNIIINTEEILSPEEKFRNIISPEFIKYKPTGEEMIEISYIYGPNRSGKTFYAANYAKKWSDIFKNWPIYLFSRRDIDKVLDDLQQLRRISIDEDSLLNCPDDEKLTMTDFECSLVIFDDIDTISNIKLRKYIQKLRDDIMETGRQKMIYVINTSHLGMNYGPTRTVLNEANSYTLFPRKGNYGHNYKILKEKMGLKTSIIKAILDKTQPNGQPGLSYIGEWGWITIYKDSPQYLIYENGVLVL